MKKFTFMFLALSLGLALSACGKSEVKSEEKSDVTKVTWLTSRPVGGAIDEAMREIADEYSKEKGGKWEINFETTADRPSYLQKLKTLVAGGNMPDIIDIDPDVYAAELVDAGKLVDMKSFLKENNYYDDFYPTAVKYQEFIDGSMYTLPLEYHVEMIWYNKKIFSDLGISVPQTMDEWLDACKKINESGTVPISVDGVDRWPVQRYLAMMAFRQSGNKFIQDLSQGKQKMNSEIGLETAGFVKDIGKYFNNGFSATDYATAQSMFLDGKSAMYYIGDWEIAAMDEKYEAGEIDYFYMPTIKDGTTDANEFCVNSGIGMAFNADTFDEKSADFVKYLLENYADVYTRKMQMSPIKSDLPEDVELSKLALRVRDDMDKTGEQFMKPWDTYLDPSTNTIVQDNLLLVGSGELSVKDFADMIDESIEVNVKNK